MYVLAAPDRLVVDIPSLEFRLPLAAGEKGAGLATAFRYGQLAPGKARIVVDLREPSRVLAVTQRAVSAGRQALVIDIAAKQYGLAGNKAVAAASGDSRPTVVIDPGHGGVDPGAVSNKGVLEKVIVLAVGKRLAEVLRATGRFRVALTRDRDKYVSLDDRVEQARTAGAALFLSLHADSVEGTAMALGASGASVYILSNRASDVAARRFAAKENAADRLAGIMPRKAVADSGVRNILVDLLKRETERESKRLRAALVRSLRRNVPVAKQPFRAAAFHVLKQTETPAALIELGYISNPLDLQRMRRADWQQRVAKAIANAVSRFFRKKR